MDTERTAILSAEERIAWDLYFAAVASIQYHPANPPEKRLSLAELASIADMMLEVRRCRS